VAAAKSEQEKDNAEKEQAAKLIKE